LLFFAWKRFPNGGLCIKAAIRIGEMVHQSSYSRRRGGAVQKIGKIKVIPACIVSISPEKKQ
jgi:hypothetical protein